jgi:two-component system CheB/CheR fusion protein
MLAAKTAEANMKDEAMQECNEVPEQNLAEEPHFHAGVGPLQSDDEPQSTEQTELERLRELNTAQLQFLAVLSHELRNPATSLTMGLSLLDVVPPDSQQALRARTIMRNQTQLLIKLLNELQDIARLERGTLALSLEPVDLKNIAAEEIEGMKPLYNELNVELQAQLPEGPLRLQGDPLKLGEMIRYLLENALHSSRPGAVVKFLLQEDLSTNTAVVIIQDQGHGYAAADLELVFKPFALSDRRFDKIRHGLGVAPYIVQGLAGLHEGQAEVQSAGIGKGTKFLVRLPLAL